MPKRIRPDGFHRKKNLKYSFGISVEEYEAMVASQGGVCAICKQPETVNIRGKLLPLTVDHDHDTGRIRGLLCHRCNRGLGFFDDNEERLRAAAEYVIL